MDHGIQRCETNQILVNWLIVSLLHPVEIEEEDDVGEGTERYNEHDKENLDVLDNFGDHADEGAEWLEEAHPVEQLEPHHEDRNGTVDLQFFVWNPVGDFTHNVHTVEGQRTEINQIPDVKEVTYTTVLNLDHFQDNESDKGLAENDQCDNFENEVCRQLVLLMVREVSSVKDERNEVEHEWYEQLIEDCTVVTLPHEIDKDTDLSSRKYLIVVSLRKDLDQAG